MLINITTTNIDKTHNIYAASTYMIFVMTCLWNIHVTKKIWIFYGQEYVLIYLKQLESFGLVYVKIQKLKVKWLIQNQNQNLILSLI